MLQAKSKPQSRLFPKKVIKSVYGLDYQAYYDRGFRGIIVDIDNTLVKDNAPADHKARKLIKGLKKIGFKTCIVSNSSRDRVRAFAKKVKSPYVYKARKPSPKGIQKAMQIMETDEKTTLFIGDQIYTDILAANNAGVYSILTDVIDPEERRQVKIKRFFEKPVIKRINALRKIGSRLK
ncbi:MAG: YqeG family HAD IIIA-type phosphatase [Lachnospiraceae bacterium]|nr:YqeG family HAD IIIA-type phosphatase [Lachnospiraceae bacterium]